MDELPWHDPNGPLPDTPCTAWQGHVNAKGYGSRNRQGRNMTGPFRTRLVHRQVMAMVHGEDALDGLAVLHLCDNPPCFRYDHLRVGSLDDNNQDMRRKGRVRSGERHHATKMPPAMLAEIGRRYEAGESQKSLAREYGINQSQISRRLRGVNK